MSRIHLGISTCPNDTFAFHGLLTGAVDTEGLELDIELLDVQELNERFAKGDFDVSKLSFAAMLQAARDLLVLPVGAALGFGVGPVVLARKGLDTGALRLPLAADAQVPADWSVLCPGANTTATLLWRLFHPHQGQLRQVVFHEIMPALERGAAELGVCIHEGRFTYAEAGLTLAEDLGATWEARTQGPMPLGGIAARRTLRGELAARVARAIRRSIEHARADPNATAATMARYAQDQTRASHFQHVALYVNDWTVDLLRPGGPEALQTLSRLALQTGAADRGPLELLKL